MTTLNAKANAAYHELIAKTERDNPGDVWAGFEHERDAFETGWEAGHEAARPVVDREALRREMRKALDSYVERGPAGYYEHTDAVLALINGSES